MRIAVCDDVRSDCNLLTLYLEEYALKHCLKIGINVYCSGEELLNAAVDHSYDIVFLDIYMSGRNGIETARELIKTGSTCRLIFTTSSREHAVESYDLNAVHYLMKPLCYEQLEKAMDRCKELFRQSEQCIEVLSERVLMRIIIKNLMFAEVFGNMTVIHTISGNIKTYMSLEDLTRLLPKDRFLRCHRSYLVNMYYISDVGGTEFILKNNDRIPIRRPDRQQMKQRYADCLFSMTRSDYVDE